MDIKNTISSYGNKFSKMLSKTEQKIMNQGIPKLSFLLIFCSFLITLLFLIIATYSPSIYDILYAAASYISIILIILCFVLLLFKYKPMAI